ncbi:MAG: S26 family signal peptidase [Chloroflexi bacterium]|nr:S26 family signal peptidase [Chloroflexota bacterium]
MSRKSYRRLLRLISVVPGLYAIVAFACARRVRINGASMSTALLPGQRVLFDRLAFTRDGPRVGDVALLQHPGRPALRIVKRITAAAGDIAGGRALEGGEYWVEGDNFGASTDSRDFGPVRRRHLLARAWLVYWPQDDWRRL